MKILDKKKKKKKKKKQTLELKFLRIGSYDKWFCIKSSQTFANLLLLCKAPDKNDFLQDVESIVVY